MKTKIKNPEGLLCSYLNNINERLDEYLYVVGQGLISNPDENINTDNLKLVNDKDLNIADVFTLDYVSELKQKIRLEKIYSLENIELITSAFITDNKKLQEVGFSLELIYYIIEARLLGELDFKKIPKFFAILFSKLNI
jgi:hypothetical protein